MIRAEKMGVVYENYIFWGKKINWKKLFRHNLMCIVQKFHENLSRNEEIMVILMRVHATMLHPVKFCSGYL